MPLGVFENVRLAFVLILRSSEITEIQALKSLLDTSMPAAYLRFLIELMG